MSKQSETEFISKIDLENYPPFKDGRILFKGENEIQALIKFYLENKKVKDSEKNAQRFKINCIVGENGVGKSTLLWKIIDDFWSQEGSEYQQILLDDFFVLSSNFSKLRIDKEYINLNNIIFKENLPSGQNYWFNGFLSGLFAFDLLNKQTNTLSFFSAFHPKVQGYRLVFSKSTKVDSFPFRKKFLNKESVNDVFWTRNNYKDMFSVLKELYAKIKKDNKDNLVEFLMWAIEYAFQKKYNRKTMDERLEFEHVSWVHSKDSWNQYWKNLWDKQETFCEDLITLIQGVDLAFESKILVLSLFFENIFWNIDLVYGGNLSFSSLSSWEKIVALRLWNIYREIMKIYKKWRKNNSFLILIDEPDLHLHLDWQRQYIQKLIDVFSTLPTDIKLHFVIATHSPFLISDLPTESIVALKKDDRWNTEVLELKKNSTFWANFVDLIRNGFFFKDQMLMWSFAETIIKNLAQNERDNLLKENNNQDWSKNGSEKQPEKSDSSQDTTSNIKNMIWDDFLRDNLLYFKPY